MHKVNRNVVPWEFRHDYHYYEPKIYDLNKYFGGFNFRQLRRFLFIFRQVNLSHRAAWHWVKHGTPTEKEIALLPHIEAMAEKCCYITQQLMKLKKNSELTKCRCKDTLGDEYDYNTLDNFRRSSLLEFKKNPQGKFVWNNPDNPYDNSRVEDHWEDVETHRRHAQQNIRLIFSWDYWMAYLKEAIMEDMDQEIELEVQDMIELQKLTEEYFKASDGVWDMFLIRHKLNLH